MLLLSPLVGFAGSSDSAFFFGQMRHGVVFELLFPIVEAQYPCPILVDNGREFVSHIYMCNKCFATNALEPAWILEFLGQMGQQKKCTFALWFCPNSCRKLLSFLRGVDKAGTVVVIIRSLGVEAAASRAVNEIPTPNGVA